MAFTDSDGNVCDWFTPAPAPSPNDLLKKAQERYLDAAQQHFRYMTDETYEAMTVARSLRNSARQNLADTEGQYGGQYSDEIIEWGLHHLRARP